jgi:predicted DNA-binding protein
MAEDFVSAERLRDLADATIAADAFAHGNVQYLDEPVDLPPAPSGDVMVVRSLRLPVDLELRAKAVAAARGLPTSELLREWIADGVERAEAGEQRDPVAELHRIADAANRALQALETRRHVA